MPYNNDDDNDILLKRRSSNRTSNTDRNSHPPRRTTERRPVTNHSSGSGSDSGNHGSRPPVNRRKRKRKKKTWKNILHILLVLALIAAISLAAWVLVLATDLPEVSPETLMPKQTSFVYDQNDEAYADLYSGENRVTVPLDEMPQHLKDVVIATEDIRFYKHFGIDVKRVFGAVKADLISGGFSQGASTITMQLARNAILESQDKKLNRKIKESILSIQIERQYSKDEILYFYLNEVYLGMRATYGVEAASHLYFDKDVQDISLGESALLAGLLRNPGMYSPFENIEKATHIRNVALDNLIRYKPEYKEAAEAAKQETLIVCEDPKGPNINYNHPWFTDYVVDEAGEIMEELSLDKAILYTGGLHIYTTLDANTQDRMEEIYEDNDYFPSSRTKDIVESS
ncbi:MAG: transglycosylase domain-containing protein, partial [Clostridiales bacterium]